MLTALRETWDYPASVTLCAAFLAVLGVAWCRLRAERTRAERERRGREEMEAYARLDLRVSSHGDLKSLPRRVCSVIAARSPFGRVAMLMYAPGDRLCVVATEGMDEPAVKALEAWLSEGQPDRDALEHGGEAARVRLGSYSSVVHLRSEHRTGGMAVLVPIKAGERKIGALLVGADSILQVPRRLAEEAVIGLEALAPRLGYELEHLPSDLQPLAFESVPQQDRYIYDDPFAMVMSRVGGKHGELGLRVQKI